VKDEPAWRHTREGGILGWTDADIDALREGSPTAVDRLYRAHARQVLAWVIRLGGPSLDAEDVAQDVFAVALRTVSGFRGASSPSTWLFGITRNVVRNARRRAAFRRFFGLDSVPEPADTEPGPDEALIRLRRRRQVQAALERLSADHREVVVLCEIEGRSAPEAAILLGIAEGTVYSRLHHARRKFASALASEGLDLALGFA
jgi:RNA polymerase sigma-70 factor (ECF subfamily)